MLNYSTNILLTQSLNGTVLNSFAPFTLTINPSAVNGITKKIYKIDYIFDTETVSQKYFYKTPEVNPPITYPYPQEVGDPRNYIQSQTFFLPNVYKKDYTVSVDIYQIGIATPTNITFTLSLSAPKLDGSTNAMFSAVHLSYTRMFGFNNNILYILETEEPKYYIPVILNWNLRPIQPEPLIIEQGYRPYRILEPYENQAVTPNFQNIDFVNEEGNYRDVNYPPPA
jgi:hypothetical protein